jgi:hypothetical protein
MTVQRPHDADAGKHRVAAAAAQHQRLDCCLPFVELLLGLRKCGDVLASIQQRDQHTAILQRYPVLELALPALVSHLMFSQWATGRESAPLDGGIPQLLDERSAPSFGIRRGSQECYAWRKAGVLMSIVKRHLAEHEERLALIEEICIDKGALVLDTATDEVYFSADDAAYKNAYVTCFRRGRRA